MSYLLRFQKSVIQLELIMNEIHFVDSIDMLTSWNSLSFIHFVSDLPASTHW